MRKLLSEKLYLLVEIELSWNEHRRAEKTTKICPVIGRFPVSKSLTDRAAAKIFTVFDGYGYGDPNLRHCKLGCISGQKIEALDRNLPTAQPFCRRKNPRRFVRNNRRCAARAVFGFGASGRTRGVSPGTWVATAKLLATPAVQCALYDALHHGTKGRT